MVFSSLPFLFIFLPVCLILYYVIPSLKWKNIVLLSMSIIFYATGEPVYVLLLVACALVGYLSGFLIEKYKDNKKISKTILGLTVIICLSSLFVFKYLNFTISNLNLISFVNIPLVKLTMPIGISFFTFQTISYDIDLYKGNAKLQKNFGKFLLFVSLFPQLIAGPILRYTDIADQLDKRETNIDCFADGITRFLCGCAKKVLLANVLGGIVDNLFKDGVKDMTTLAVWTGVICFSLQIYYDFSGYSDMAIGLGKMFGFEYAENFNYPYISRSITDFWRRWHISLSSFFRDYVYIPLGGNKKHQILNLFVVWALTGLWHGASWNFVLWGLYFFVLLVIEKFLLKRKIENIPVISNIVALVLIVIGWAIFYFEDTTVLLGALGKMFSFEGGFTLGTIYNTLVVNKIPYIAISVVGCIPLGAFAKKRMSSLKSKMPTAWFVITLLFDALLLFLCVSALVSSSYNPFLYFRF